MGAGKGVGKRVVLSKPSPLAYAEVQNKLGPHAGFITHQ